MGSLNKHLTIQSHILLENSHPSRWEGTALSRLTSVTQSEAKAFIFYFCPNTQDHSHPVPWAAAASVKWKHCFLSAMAVVIRKFVLH